MLKIILILGGVMLLAFAGGVVHGYINQLQGRIRALRERVKELNRQNTRLRRQCADQFDRACNLNVALGESRQSVERLQSETTAQQRQLAVKDRLLQAQQIASNRKRFTAIS